MRVLIVGAGAVGQVYGHHLARAGAEVTLYVREKYREATRAGFTMVAVASKGKRAERFTGFEVVCSAAEVKGAFDFVIITVPSTGLAGPWLPELIAALGDATIVAMSPGPEDRQAVLAAGAREDHLVSGLISMVSYHAPLPGEPLPASTAFWFPPGQKNLFSGPRAAQIVAAMRSAGVPAKQIADVQRAVVFPNGAFMAYLLALEAAGWSFKTLRQAGHLAAGTRGARQAIAITAHQLGPAPLGIRLMTRSWLMSLGLRVATWLAPFPLETYLQAHFTKVGAQTRFIVAALIARGRAAGLPVDALEGLLG